MSNECQDCRKIFSNKSNLKAHRKRGCTAAKENIWRAENKFLKEENRVLVEEVNGYKNTKAEIATLKETNRLLAEEIIALKEELQKCKDARLEIAEKRAEKLENHILKENSKPRNVTLNLAPFDFSKENIEEICMRYTAEEFNAGPEATYKFILDNHLTSEDGRPRLKCTDTSRKTFVSIREDGSKSVDVGGQKVVTSLARPMKKTVINICNSIENITDEDFRKKLTPHQRVLEPSRLAKRLATDLKE